MEVIFTPYNELYHYGILGMKWGVRRYQNKDGALTKAGRKRYSGGLARISYSKKNVHGLFGMKWGSGRHRNKDEKRYSDDPSPISAGKKNVGEQSHKPITSFSDSIEVGKQLLKQNEQLLNMTYDDILKDL